jgi:hypothetical protein
MSLRDTYRVRVTAIVSGWAHYYCPAGDKISHFVDDTAEVTWDLSTVRDFEYHEADYEGTFDNGDEDADDDCPGGCDIEDADGPDARAPYPRSSEDTPPDNDDGPPF